MDYENLRTEMDGDLLIVTLHWPERRNAMTQQMRVDLLDCARRAEADDAVKAIVFTDMAIRRSCAGANIPELRTTHAGLGDGAFGDAAQRAADRHRAPRQAYRRRDQRLLLRCGPRNSPWAAQSASRAKTAQLALPEINLGQIPGSGGTQRLYRFVGLGWAMQMVLTGQRVDAETAREIGLVTEVMPLADLMSRAKELARLMGAASPHGLRRRARRRLALDGNGASGGHRL